MKKILLSTIYFLACIFSIRAKTLYGTVSDGEKSGGGAIIKFIPATDNLKVVKSFESIGIHPTGSLVQASNGKLYGTANGGRNGNGVIFSYDPSTFTYTILKDFGSDGISPCGSLIQASDGKLYGMT